MVRMTIVKDVKRVVRAYNQRSAEKQARDLLTSKPVRISRNDIDPFMTETECEP